MLCAQVQHASEPLEANIRDLRYVPVLALRLSSMLESKQPNSPQPLAAADHKEIWPLVVEKAFAKLHGSYEAIEGGLIGKALTALTGSSAESVSTDTHTVTRVWDRIKPAIQNEDFFVGAGSRNAQDDRFMNGIVSGHA